MCRAAHMGMNVVNGKTSSLPLFYSMLSKLEIVQDMSLSVASCTDMFPRLPGLWRTSLTAQQCCQGDHLCRIDTSVQA